MALDAKTSTDLGSLALQLIRLEEEVQAFRELHEQELRALQVRLYELRAALARLIETGPSVEGRDDLPS